MAPKPKYQDGEKVLCYHGPLLYEAKCMGAEVRDGKPHYLIHYNGWNKNWDELVLETRVVKFNEAGVVKQKELLKSHSALTKKNKTAKKLEKELLRQEKIQERKEKQSTKDKEPSTKDKEKPTAKEKKEKEKKTKEPKERSSTPQPSVGDKRKADKNKDKVKEKKEPEKEEIVPASQATTSTSQDSSNSSQASGEPKRKRPRLDDTVETEETYLSKIEIKVKIPDDLKPVLVDDWDLITRQKMLLTTPSKQTVDEIIEEYVKSKTSKNSTVNKDAMIETMLGCKDYFNVMLGTQLLYKFERPQYSEILSENPDKCMSSIYGATHFLRLFVRLGAMLSYSTLDERTVHILLNHVHDFLKYMSKNGAGFFKTANYEIASPDYHRKAI